MKGDGLTTDPFSIDDATAQRLLSVALGRGGDDADLFFEATSAFSLVFEGGKVRQLSRHIDKGVGVRVYGVTPAASPTREEADRGVDSASVPYRRLHRHRGGAGVSPSGAA